MKDDNKVHTWTVLVYAANVNKSMILENNMRLKTYIIYWSWWTKIENSILDENLPKIYEYIESPRKSSKFSSST